MCLCLWVDYYLELSPKGSGPLPTHVVIGTGHTRAGMTLAVQAQLLGFFLFLHWNAGIGESVLQSSGVLGLLWQPGVFGTWTGGGRVT